MKFEILGSAGEASGGEVFVRFFAEASRGWIIPILGTVGGALLPDEALAGDTGYTEYRGPAGTAELAARLRQGEALPPIPCALFVRVPEGQGTKRRLVFRRAREGALQPLAILEVERAKLVLSFPADGEPIVARSIEHSALERERWALAAKEARAELEAVLARMRAGGSTVTELLG